jgi:hypothetical protein
MDLVTRHEEPYPTKQETPVKIGIESDVDSRATAHKRRIAALHLVAGIWANRTDIPADGLQYERELRDEWQ